MRWMDGPRRGHASVASLRNLVAASVVLFHEQTRGVGRFKGMQSLIILGVSAITAFGGGAPATASIAPCTEAIESEAHDSDLVALEAAAGLSGSAPLVGLERGRSWEEQAARELEVVHAELGMVGAAPLVGLEAYQIRVRPAAYASDAFSRPPSYTLP
jgi:hypothetical protein